MHIIIYYSANQGDSMVNFQNIYYSRYYVKVGTFTANVDYYATSYYCSKACENMGTLKRTLNQKGKL